MNRTILFLALSLYAYTEFPGRYTDAYIRLTLSRQLQRGELDAIEHHLLFNYYENNRPEPFPGSYLANYARAKEALRPPRPLLLPLESYLTFYGRYTLKQIEKMGQLMATYLKEADSQTLTLLMKDREGKETIIPLNETEIVRLAYRRFLLKCKDSKIKPLDALIAGLETHQLPPALYKVMAQDQRWQVKESKKGEKLLSYLKNLALITGELHPIYGPYLLVAAIFWEMEIPKESVDEELYLIN